MVRYPCTYFYTPTIFFLHTIVCLTKSLHTERILRIWNRIDLLNNRNATNVCAYDENVPVINSPAD